MKQKSEMTEAEESLVELEVEKMLETGLKIKRMEGDEAVGSKVPGRMTSEQKSRWLNDRTGGIRTEKGGMRRSSSKCHVDRRSEFKQGR
jgi:hypothetical protein